LPLRRKANEVSKLIRFSPCADATVVTNPSSTTAVPTTAFELRFVIVPPSPGLTTLRGPLTASLAL